MSEIKLPKDWKWSKIGDIVEMQSGMAFKKAEYSTEGVRLFQIANVSFNYTKWDEVDYLPIEYIESHKHLLLNKGDIVLALNRPMLNNQLKIAELKHTDVPAILYQRVGRFIFNEIINKSYFLYYFQSPIFLKWLSEQLQGVNIPFINKSKLFSFDKFPLPSLKTQQAIVSKIEELFSELDKGIEDLKTAQRQLKTYRQSVLKWAFEGKLTNEDVKDGVFPEGWEKTQIKNIALINPKLPNKELIAKETEIQFLPMKLVEAIINKIHLTEIRKFDEVLKGSYTPFIDGDVVFAKVTPCMENGKIAIVEKLKNGIGFGSSEFHVLRTNEKVSNKFIFYFLVQDRFRNEAANEMTGAVGLRRVPKQFIENYLIPVTSIEEQYLIVQEIESRLSVADKMEESIAQSLQQAEALRQSILKKAFSGQLL